MATVYGSYVKTNGSGSTKSLRSYLTYSTSTTETQVTLTIQAGINIISGWHTDAKITKVLTVAGATAYSATNSTHYNTGSTQIVSKTYTYTRGTAAASKAFNFKLTPSGQSTSTASASISVPAKNKYTVTFNHQNDAANTTNTNFYGTVITLPTPTYMGYDFKSWNTAADGTGTTYNAGASYTITKNITLYAQWELAYTAPSILQVTTYRVQPESITTLSTLEDINAVPMDSQGECAFYKIVTDLGQNVNESSSVFSGVTYTSSRDETVQTAVTQNNTKKLTENERIWAGFITGANSTTFNKDYAYKFNINLNMTDISDIVHTTSIASSISADKYVLDIAKDGMRIAFGQKATDNSEDTPRTDFGVEIYGDLSIINSLNPSGTPIVDYVIEQDTDGDWTYRIWASGLKELWFRKAIGTVTTTQGSRGGYKSLSYSGAPITITNLKSISGNGYSSTYSSAFINLGFSSSGTLSGYFQCWAGGTSGTATLSNCVVDAYIVGY